MIIEKYIVRDMAEAFERGKASLGEDAILLTQRMVRQKGLKGFFKSRRLEVTMAVENRPTSEAQAYLKKRSSLTGQSAERDQSADPGLKDESDLFRERGAGSSSSAEQGEEQEVILIQELESLEAFRHYSAVNRLDHIQDEKLKALMVRHFVREFLDDGDFSGIQAFKAAAFIGSTGVGKTTTIAKIAAEVKLNQGRRVGFITMDTYRIGAVEQLKKYAEIMDLPMMTITAPQEMKPAYQKLSRTCDLVLIDTLGTSYRNQTQIKEIQRYLDEIEGLCKIVVLPATLNQEIFEKTMEAYRMLSIDRVILTKLDEMDCPTRLFGYLRRLKEPLVYVTTGQNVPDDLLKATPEHLMSYLGGGFETL